MLGQQQDDDPRLENTYRELAAGPELYLKDLDFETSNACFVPMTEDNYAESSFLDYRLRSKTELVYDIDLSMLLRLKADFERDKRPIQYIFHVGHCGSTLLSRVLGSLPGFFSLREPEPLRVLSRHARHIGEPGHPIGRAVWDQAFALVVGLLSRTYRAGDVALVKPSSFCNRLIKPLLGWTTGCRAILLYIDLETYLATMLRAHQKETNSVVTTYHRADAERILGAGVLDAEGLSDARKTALVWLINTFEFYEATRDPVHRGMVHLLNFEDFLADRARVLIETSAFLGKASAEDVAREAAADAGLNRTYAKGQEKEPYDAATRAGEIESAKNAFAEEIADGRAWAAALCRDHPVLAGMSRAPDFKMNQSF